MHSSFRHNTSVQNEHRRGEKEIHYISCIKILREIVLSYVCCTIMRKRLRKIIDTTWDSTCELAKVLKNQCINHHKTHEVQLCNQCQKDLQTHSNASIEKLYHRQGCPWCHRNKHSQTSSLFLLLKNKGGTKDDELRCYFAHFKSDEVRNGIT